jgi:hypothetical protein
VKFTDKKGRTMNKEEKALKEVEAYQWMKSKGYDRRSCKDIAPILVNYLNDELSKLHQPTVIRCSCHEEDKTGTVKIDCCNICGLPDEEWWGKNCL